MDPKIFYSVARILGDIRLVDDDGKLVGKRRGLIGSGFMVGVGHGESRYQYLLTADHVLEEQAAIEVQFANIATGEFYPPVPAPDWRRPLDDVDLAICSVNSIRWDTMLAVLEPSSLFATPLEEFIGDPQIGSPMAYLGTLDPLDRPMLRSGTIGTIDQVGVEHDGGYVYTCHLVDCRSYEGFSGSLCFQIVQFASLDRPFQMPEVFARHEDLGTLSEVRTLYVPDGMFTEHLDDENPDGAASRYGVGIMVRQQEIREALMSDDFAKEREDWERGSLPTSGQPRLRAVRKHVEPVTRRSSSEFKRVEPKPRRSGVGAALDSSKAPEASEEFERFEDLTRKLVTTPKTAPEDG